MMIIQSKYPPNLKNAAIYIFSTFSSETLRTSDTVLNVVEKLKCNFQTPLFQQCDQSEVMKWEYYMFLLLNPFLAPLFR